MGCVQSLLVPAVKLVEDVRARARRQTVVAEVLSGQADVEQDGGLELGHLGRHLCAALLLEGLVDDLDVGVVDAFLLPVRLAVLDVVVDSDGLLVHVHRIVVPALLQQLVALLLHFGRPRQPLLRGQRPDLRQLLLVVHGVLQVLRPRLEAALVLGHLRALHLGCLLDQLAKLTLHHVGVHHCGRRRGSAGATPSATKALRDPRRSRRGACPAVPRPRQGTDFKGFRRCSQTSANYCILHLCVPQEGFAPSLSLCEANT